MKRGILVLGVVSAMIFTSCKKDAYLMRLYLISETSPKEQLLNINFHLLTQEKLH